MKWLAHFDAQRLGLIASAHGTSIVVAQHHHRPAAQLWAKQALTAHIEIVAVDQGEHGHVTGGAVSGGCP